MDIKATGFVRKMDNLGRVVIPKELRKKLHIKDGEPLEIFVAEDSAEGVGIFVKKYKGGTVNE